MDRGDSVASQFAEAIVDGCLPMARGEADFATSSLTQDQELIEAQDFQYGIGSEVHDRFGLQGSGILNRAVMGNRVAEESVFVLAIGGALPGCKVILLSPEERDFADETSAALSALHPVWRELPFAQTRPGSDVKMRRFIMRHDDNKPYLINLIATPIPDSQVRLLATLSPIPAQVQIPEGY
ncbi:hypothetical protein ACXYN8_05050 [Altererythrobacter sp. CAU 1778]